ncbi:hypothetical protein KY290_001458 [Solanum tuberosum]|uniref:RNase H type-1 domain-containing protein n=1 Tax=Solanum tuberosum TaxID=4113 RepID=A0ABQ7WPH8_SOLTU|nr:hypothetical protein KY290_001458 [Solanum tuberosum]
METMMHLLLIAPIAQRLWKQFASCAGFSIDGLNIHQLLSKWWEYEAYPKLQHIMKAIAAIVMWELWKRRNARQHDKEVTFSKMYLQCQLTIHLLIKAKCPWIRNISYHWNGKFDLLQGYKPNLYYHIVKWSLPKLRWIKCNTDGASKGNPSEISYGFCVRDKNGDLLYAEAQSIGITTNMEAELRALWEGLKYCKEQGFNQIMLETDSLSLKNMIKQNWRVPWVLAERIQEIQKMMELVNSHLDHNFREANQLADFITNLAINQEGKQ